jgi:hypothetical protein
LPLLEAEPTTEQLKGARHRADIAGAGVLQRQVEDAGADLLAAADLLDHPVGAVVARIQFSHWLARGDARSPPANR